MDDHCADCGCSMSGEDVSVEAFEVTGQILCGMCAESALTDDGGWGEDDEGLSQ